LRYSKPYINFGVRTVYVTYMYGTWMYQTLGHAASKWLNTSDVAGNMAPDLSIIDVSSYISGHYRSPDTLPKSSDTIQVQKSKADTTK